jgi:hypothetical protein
MILSSGYHTVPPGKLADVQTFLEMREMPVLRPCPDAAWNLEYLTQPDLPRYRELVHRVGDDYLWASR